MNKPALIALAEDLLRGETRDFLLIYKTPNDPIQVSTTDKTWAIGAACLASELVDAIEVPVPKEDSDA